ncbi:MAG: HD domain-containing protein [Candidatus Taylorbacteria bacterium]|nr:HD domain-containing protein [Candidatus Taylorbacteria bacterium]
MLKRDIEFLYEIGTLKNTERSWQQFMGSGCATVPEHSFRVVFLALLIARGEKFKDEEKILKMSLVHDLSETRTGDTNYLTAVYTKRDDKQAVHDIFLGTSFADLNKDILHEYEERKTLAAKIVKDADNLDVDIELKEMEERGSIIAKKMEPSRKLIRTQKLYTKTAKKIWDEIQKADPASWHLKANKWVKVKDAGR